MIPKLTHHNEEGGDDWMYRESDRYFIVVSNYKDEYHRFDADYKSIHVRDYKYNTSHVKKFYSGRNVINKFNGNSSQKEAIEIVIENGTN